MKNSSLDFTLTVWCFCCEALEGAQDSTCGTDGRLRYGTIVDKSEDKGVHGFVEYVIVVFCSMQLSNIEEVELGLQNQQHYNSMHLSWHYLV